MHTSILFAAKKHMRAKSHSYILTIYKVVSTYLESSLAWVGRLSKGTFGCIILGLSWETALPRSHVGWRDKWSWDWGSAGLALSFRDSRSAFLQRCR